jgi:hypothetical protein
MQLGNTQQSASAPRSIMTLERKPSWTTKPEDVTPVNFQPFVQLFGDMSGTRWTMEVPIAANWSAILLPPGSGPGSGWALGSTYPDGLSDVKSTPANILYADDTISTLFRDFYAESGSLARAVSSLITLLSGMAYYDQLPRFQTMSQTSQVFFTTVLFPQSHQGLFVVAGILLVHNILVVLVVCGFLSYSRHTLLGNHWQAVKQLCTPQTNNILLKSSISKDREIVLFLKDEGRDHENFRLG